MSDLTRLYNEREQIEVMMEVCLLPSSQDTLRERLDEVNRKNRHTRKRTGGQ